MLTFKSPEIRDLHTYFLRPASGAPGAAIQQPGSPGWPQQFLPCRSLERLFLNRRPIFLLNGMGPARLVKIPFRFGLSFLSHIYRTYNVQ